MEVCHNVVGVVIRTVDTRLAEHDPCYTTNGEQEDEAHRKQHRCAETDGATPDRRDPAKDLNACWYRDNHSSDHEVRLLAEAHADGVHVVRPDDEAEGPNGNHSVNHGQVAKDRLAREGCNNVADDAEGRQDHNVHFGVTKEPQDVLVQHGVATACRIKEGSPKVTVRQQHGDSTSQNRQSQKDQPCSHKDRPSKQRHFVQRHAGGAHVEEGCDDVDRT